MVVNVRRNFFLCRESEDFYDVRKKKICVLYINI